MTDTAQHTYRRARRVMTTLMLLSGMTAALSCCGEPASGSNHSDPRDQNDHGVHEDGNLADPVSVFDDEHAAVTRLDPDLLDALREAGSAAREDEIEVQITSGWRSPAFQAQLLEEAVAEHGSRAEAARWVATPDTSSHVSGNAVDIHPYDAIDWLARFGDAYGLCQIYGNEPWHFELRPQAITDGCPLPYPDPTYDPRLS